MFSCQSDVLLYPHASPIWEIRDKVVLRDPKAAGKLLPWVHRVISNAKAVLRGTHRGVSEKHLQSYLAEICYRFNRRFWEKQLFDRLIKACVTTQTVTYRQLTGRPQAL